MKTLYYITQPLANITYAEQVERVCMGGIRLIQLRMKDVSVEEYLNTALQVKQVTDTYSAKLIINDNLNIACASGAAGVHLGINDIHPAKARLKVAHGTLIGGTANTFERIKEIYAYVDYIGLGPFAFTTTKKNLSPILGIEGYQHIMQQMRDANITKPVYAIGGIEPNDIPAILHTGVSGIALSSTIAKSIDITQTTAMLLATYFELHAKE